MATKISTKTAQDMLGGVGLSNSLAHCVGFIYSGAQPTSADSASTGTLLGMITKNGAPVTSGDTSNGLVFGIPTLNNLSKSSDTWQYTGLANGVAGWIRFASINDTGVADTSYAFSRLDIAVGTPGSGAEGALSNVNIRVGDPGTLDSMKITLPTS